MLEITETARGRKERNEAGSRSQSDAEDWEDWEDWALQHQQKEALAPVFSLLR